MIDFVVLGGSSFFGRAFMERLGASCTWHHLSRQNGFDLVDGYHHMQREIERLRPRYIANFIALNMVGESWEHAGDYYRTNVEAMARLLNRLRGLDGLEKFVEVSTPEVYGCVTQRLREDAPYNPSTPYAVSRVARDQHLALMHKQYGFPVVFTRTVNIYGPGQQLYRIVPRTIMAALTGRKLQLHGGGVSSRSFIHVRDAAMGVYLAATKGEVGEVYHTSTVRMVRIVDLVRMIAERMGKTLDDVAEVAPERPGKDPAYLLDSNKARYELGWRDTVTLEEGLDETIAWYRDNFDRLKDQLLEYEHRA